MLKVLVATLPLLSILAAIPLVAQEVAAAPDPDRAVICTHGHSATLRLPKAMYYKLRDAAFARAGIPTHLQCRGDADPRPDCYILDHVIPLELCLASDDCNRLDNVQVQTRAAAKEKDQVENAERRRYCYGEETRPGAASHFSRTTK